MDFSIDTIIALISLFIGGGGGAFFTWRYQRRKAQAEAESAEISATKEMQDMYQQMQANVGVPRAIFTVGQCWWKEIRRISKPSYLGSCEVC